MNTKRTTSNAQPVLDFDWALIRSFLAVMDAGSLLGAARRLTSSQPTIGRHIEALESQLDKTLFERTGRGLTPTAAARLIAEHARSMQAGADQLVRTVAGSDSRASGLVRITASRMVAQHLLPEIVATLQAEAPQIDIAIVASDEVSNLLRRDADIAIRMVKPVQSSLIARKLGEFKILPCASVKYLDRYGTPRKVRDLLSHRLIGSDQDKTFHQVMAQQAAALGIDPSELRISVRCDDFVTQFAAIRAGLAVGFAADYMINRHADVTPLPIDLAIPALPVWLAVHRELRTSPRIRQVFDSLARSLKAVQTSPR